MRELGLRGTLKAAGIFLLVMALAYAPFHQAGWKLLSSTWLMATNWSFNGSLGALLELALPMQTAHLVSAILLAIALLLTAWWGNDLLSRLALAMAALVICTPTLFPWYLAWMFPLLVLRPDPALLALAALAPLTDLVLIEYVERGLWSPVVWTQWIEYGVFYSLLALGAYRRWGMFARNSESLAPST